MLRSLLCRSPISGVLAAALLTVPVYLRAQSTNTAQVVSDPEVQAQVRLFSAWMEGQIEIRGLPGAVVGVVAGDDLVWAQGFGHADVDSGRAHGSGYTLPDGVP